MIYVHPYEVSEDPPVPVGAGVRGNLVRRLGHGRIRQRLGKLFSLYSKALMPMGDVVRGFDDLPAFDPPDSTFEK